MRLETTTAVKLGAVLLAAMAVLLPLVAYLRASADGDLVRSLAVGLGLLLLSGGMLKMLARARRDRAFDDGLSTNPFAPTFDAARSQASFSVPAISARGASGSRWPDRSSVATRVR